MREGLCFGAKPQHFRNPVVHVRRLGNISLTHDKIINTVCADKGFESWWIDQGVLIHVNAFVMFIEP